MNHNPQESIEYYSKTKSKLVFPRSPNPKSEPEGFEDREIHDWKVKLIGAWLFTIPIAVFMYSSKLGLFMILGNEEKIILRCLNSVVKLISFVCVCCNGTDNTENIVKKFLEDNKNNPIKNPKYIIPL